MPTLREELFWIGAMLVLLCIMAWHMAVAAEEPDCQWFMCLKDLSVDMVDDRCIRVGEGTFKETADWMVKALDDPQYMPSHRCKIGKVIKEESKQ